MSTEVLASVPMLVPGMPPRLRWRDMRTEPIPGWTVAGPDGTRYRVERVSYEADSLDQLGNPFVSTQTVLARLVEVDRCWWCSGSGWDPAPTDRWLGGQHYMRERRATCVWCCGTGVFEWDPEGRPPAHAWQPVTAALLVLLTWGRVHWAWALEVVEQW